MKYLYILFAMFFAGLLTAAPLKFVPNEITQPDGEIIECFASGDEFYNWLHDESGYTIIQNTNNGYYYYAVQSGDSLLPSSYRVNHNNPASLGIQPWLRISYDKLKPKYDRILNNIEPKRIKNENSLEVNNIGIINNIVIFIRFSDEAEFTDSTALYVRMFNAVSGNSMKNYFQEVSYNQLMINSFQYPNNNNGIVVSYQDAQPRNYYKEYSAANPLGYQTDAESTQREHTLLVNAVNAVSAQIPASLNIDNDNDNRVDNVCFIVSGSAEGWSDLLWPHRWSLYTQTVNINNKRVYDFNFQLRNSLMSSGVGVLCHEMFHSLGAPDLYHYNGNGIAPVGPWDIMENNYNPPQSMGAYMKWKYGDWITSIPQITSNGTYTLNPVTSPTNNCYKIVSPNSTSEYFVVEYRKDEGTFESSLPGSGLIVYRINPSVNGNASGPPDEVYAYRPNGTLTVNGTVNSANYSSNSGRTSITANTNPSPFLSNGTQGGISIYNIGAAGSTISFSVSFSIIPPNLIYPLNNQNFTELNTNIIWSSAFTAASYRLQISTDTLFSSNVSTYVVNDTFLTASNLQNNFTYFWRVKSLRANDSSDWSNIYKFTTLPSGYYVFLEEGFDNSSFPPANWQANVTNGTRNWLRSVSGTNPSCTPYSGTGMASYQSYSASNGHSANLITPALDLSNTGLLALEFKMYRDNGYNTYTDRIEVYINNQANTTGAYLLANINRSTALSPPVSANGWYNYNLTIPDAYKIQGAYIIFKSLSNYGNNMFIDAVKLFGVRNLVASPVLTSPANNSPNIPVNNTFAWTSVNYAVNYRIELSRYQDFSSLNQSYITNQTNYTISNLNYNATYYWRVKALTSNDSSAWSPVWTFVTSAVPLSAPVLTSPLNQAANVSITPTLKWNTVNNAVNYRIEVSRNSNFNDIIINKTLSADKLVIRLLETASQYFWRVKAFSASDSSVWSSVFSFNTMNNINIPASWNISQNDNSANIEILASGEYEIGERLFSSGDAVGIFYDDNGTERCGGMLVWGTAGENAVVFGDNPLTPIKDGFADNENYKFKIWDSFEMNELKCVVTFSSGYDYYSANGNSIINSINAIMPDTHSIAINAGWNMLSSYNLPLKDSISIIIQGLEDEIFLLKNMAGDAYWLPYMQSLKKWNYKEAYMLYSNSNFILDIIGYKIEPENTPLYFNTAGWYWVPYLNRQAMPTLDALATISGNFTMLKTIEGNVYWPGFINSLPALEPSKGYLLHINTPDTLIYPSNALSPIIKYEDVLYAEPKHFVPSHTNTGLSAIIGLKIKDALEGDEIGIFTESGMLIGSAVYEGSQLGILFWGDDFLTQEKEGASEDEKLKVIIYRDSDNMYSELIFTQLKDNLSGEELSELKYKTDAIYLAEAELGELNVNDETLNNISAVYLPEENLIKIISDLGDSINTIQVYDIVGNRVYFEDVSGEAVYYIDSSKFPSGLYNIAVQTLNSIIYKQIYIVK